MANPVREEVMSAARGVVGVGATDDLFQEALELVLAVLINRLEQEKSLARVEYEHLKEEYLKGRYRRYGTKREVETRLGKINGEIMGFEKSLSVLYRASDSGESDSEEG